MFLTSLLISSIFLISCQKEIKEEENKPKTEVNNQLGEQSENIMWQEALTNLHAWLYESGSTLDPNYTKSTQVYLCENGSFYFSVIDNITGSEFYGNWQVANKKISEPTVIQLFFTDGDIREYTLAYYQNKLYIDGSNFQFNYQADKCQ